MKLTNNLALFAFSDHKLFRIIHICNSDSEANAILADMPNNGKGVAGVIAEDDNGHVLIALEKEVEVDGPCNIMEDHELPTE